MCGLEKEDVTLVQVAPATWNGFNSFVEVCEACQASRKFKMWAKTVTSKAKAKASVAAAAAGPAGGEAPPPEILITHRQTGSVLHTVESNTLAGAKLGGAVLS